MSEAMAAHVEESGEQLPLWRDAGDGREDELIRTR